MKARPNVPPYRPLGRACLTASLALALCTPCEATVPGLARGKLLVASDALLDPNFARSVVLLLEYEPEGALGVVINRPTDVKLSSVLPEVEELATRPDTVFLGGPVARDRMVLLVRGGDASEESARVVDDVFITSSLDVLRELSRQGAEKTSFRAYVGYAGWGPGQLDREVRRGDWSIARGEAASVFEKPPEDLWYHLHERGGEWVRAPRSTFDVASLAPGRSGPPRRPQRSIGGVALPPPARKASRAATLALTS